MNDFKKGDLVICISPKSTADKMWDLPKDQILIINRVERGEAYCVLNFENNPLGYSSTRFKKCNEFLTLKII